MERWREGRVGSCKKRRLINPRKDGTGRIKVDGEETYLQVFPKRKLHQGEWDLKDRKWKLAVMTSTGGRSEPQHQNLKVRRRHDSDRTFTLCFATNHDAALTDIVGSGTRIADDGSISAGVRRATCQRWQNVSSVKCKVCKLIS